MAEVNRIEDELLATMGDGTEVLAAEVEAPRDYAAEIAAVQLRFSMEDKFRGIEPAGVFFADADPSGTAIEAEVA